MNIAHRRHRASWGAVVLAALAASAGCAESAAGPTPLFQGGLPAGAGCTFTVTPSGPPTIVPAAGGSVIVAVTTQPSCDWAIAGAGGGASFLVVEVSFATRGTGSATVRVAPNTGPERVGSVIVAGQSVTIRQLAAVE